MWQKKTTMVKTIRLALILILVQLFCNELNAQVWEPDSVYVKGRNYEIFDTTRIVSKNALGGNVFLGEGFWRGNISEYFSNQFYIGINLDIHRGRFVIQIDDYIGFGKVKQTMTFPGQLKWVKNDAEMSYMFGCNLGYSIVDNKYLLISPIAGVGGNYLTSSFWYSTSDNVENEPFLPYYKLGFFIDLKSLTLLDAHTRINDKDVYYTSLRLSFGINRPIGSPRYSEYYKGSMIYFTIGMGGLTRKNEKR